MHASQTTRRMRVTAGAGALLAAGALSAGLAAQPQTALAGDPTLEAAASSQADAGTTTTPAQTRCYPAEVEPADGCITINVSGAYAIGDVEALLDQINQLRSEAHNEGLPGLDGETVSGTWLRRSVGLEHAAQVRAAECAISFSEQRPDGRGSVVETGTDTAKDNTFAPEGTTIWAENLAKGTDAASALTQWAAEKDAYERYLAGDETVQESEYDNYRALISDIYSYVGVGAFKTADGTTYLVAEFSNTPSNSTEVRPDGACIQQVNATTNMFTPAVTTSDGSPSTLVEGNTLQLNMSFTDAAGTLWPTPTPVTWTSSNEDVATVDAAGLVSAKSTGQAIITASLGEKPLATLTVTVEKARVSVPDIAGMPTSAAKDALAAAGLSWSSTAGEEAASPDQNGVVYAQDPAAGTLVAPSTNVALSVYADYQEPYATGCDTPAPVETLAGEAPELPASTQVRWSRGEDTTEDITWDSIDPASYAASGTFNVAGSVGSTGLTVTITVNVKEKAAPTIVSVQDASVSTASGAAPELPSTVRAEMSDGSQQDVAVSWAEVDPAQYSSRAGGSFDVTGAVEGLAGVAVAHVSVSAATITEIADPEPMTTVEGTAPELPTTVKATWSNGDVTDQPVEWQMLLGLTADGKGTWDFPGDVTLTGAVEGTDIPASVTVSVTARPAPTIVSVQDASVSTASGAAPELPSTVRAEMSDGSQQDVAVSWAEVDPAQYSSRAGGSFDVTGAVEGLAGVAVAHVSVSAATITDVPACSPLTTFVNHVPELPQTVSVTWSNGDTSDEPVEWEQPMAMTADGKGTWNSPNEDGVTIPGAVEGTDIPASITVRVVQPGVTGITQPADVVTRAGQAPKLPATVQVSWEDGSTTDEAVTWDALDPAAYADAGSFAVRGTVPTAGDAKVSVTVNVSAQPAIASVASIESVTTPSGTAPALPSSVSVTWTDDSTSTGTITWDAIDESAYKARSGGEFDVKGTVRATHGMGDDTVESSSDVGVHVTVSPASVTGVEQPAAVTTRVKTAPQLAGTARVTWSNGDVTDEPVTWDAVEPAAYDVAGSFTVQGKVGETGQTVSCTVTVQAAKATAAQEAKVSTPAGKAPQLPATVQVTWDDGSVTDEPVSWDVVAADVYAKQGEFTVAGKLGGSVGLAASAKVTVTTPVAIGARVDTAVVTTTAGVAPALPKTASVAMSDGTMQEQPVAWGDVDIASYAQPGTFTVGGTAAGFNVQVSVNVAAATAQSAASVTVSTTARVAPQLPSTVRVTWSNGTVTDEPVAWESINADNYAKEGSFDVKGVAANLSATAHVNVGPFDITKTGDAGVSPLLAAMIGAGGVLAGVVGAILALRSRRAKKE